MHAKPLLAVLIVLGFQPALAQEVISRSQSVETGKSERILIAPNLKKDCSAGPLPELKVTGAPANGSLITKAGKTKTPKSYRCPGKDAAVQALFYQSKPGFTGSDTVKVEVRTADGSVQTEEIKIDVTTAKSGGKGSGNDL